MESHSVSESDDISSGSSNTSNSTCDGGPPVGQAQAPGQWQVCRSGIGSGVCSSSLSLSRFCFTDCICASRFKKVAYFCEYVSGVKCDIEGVTKDDVTVVLEVVEDGTNRGGDIDGTCMSASVFSCKFGTGGSSKWMSLGAALVVVKVVVYVERLEQVTVAV